MPDRYVFADPQPMKHQRAGLRELIRNEGTYALLWEPGVGKTRPVLDYAGVLAAAGEGECRVLVACPKAVTDSWLSQALAFLPSQVGLWGEVLHGTILQKCARLKALRGGEPTKLAKDQLVALRPQGEAAGSGRYLAPKALGAPSQAGPVRVVLAVVNLEALSSRRQVGSRTHADLIVQAIADYAPHVLVVDESHRIKAPTSNVSRVISRAMRHCPRRILLTGTPMPHSPLDVWSQWRVLDPSAFATNGRPWSFSQFQQKYAVMGGYLGKEVQGFVNLDDLSKRMAPRSMVLRKEECLDLPPVSDNIVPVRLGSAEAAAYAAMKKDLVATVGSATVSAPSKLAQMLRLRQITSGFTKDDATGALVDLGTARQDTAVGLLEDLMLAEQRVVVFAWARHEVDRLAARLRRNPPNGAEVRVITGETPDPERLAIRREFGSKAPQRIVLVCQIRAMAIGVNELVTASHALFLSLSQLRDDFEQARGRLDRQGQTRPVTFHFLVAPGTVDEVILSAHRTRTDLESALLDHVMKG